VTTPVNADFVPPPEGEVPRLLEDLAAFCNRVDLPPVMQGAVAHAQYETIHPFMDGNGRASRALISMILVRRGVANDVLPPISLILAGDAASYVRGLTTYRYTVGTDWVDFFAGAMIRAADSSELLARQVAELKEQWLEAAGRPRAGSAPRRLVEAMPTHPVLTLATAQSITASATRPAGAHSTASSNPASSARPPLANATAFGRASASSTCSIASNARSGTGGARRHARTSYFDPAVRQGPAVAETRSALRVCGDCRRSSHAATGDRLPGARFAWKATAALVSRHSSAMRRTARL